MDDISKLEWKSDLPAFPHEMIDAPLKAVVEFYLEHFRRDTEAGMLTPTMFWIVCRGLLLSAFQNYKGVCLLLAEKRAKPLMAQAAILNRSTFETLTNVIALVEAPERVSVLNREAFKSLVSRYKSFKALFGDDDKWKEYLQVFRNNLEAMVTQLNLEADDIENAEKLEAYWPTPGILIYGNERRKMEPWVTGTGQEVLKKVYASKYPYESEVAHQRIAAVSAALLVDNPEMQWNPGYGESHLVVMNVLTVACIVAELQVASGYPPHPKLAELWAYLRELDEDAKDAWRTRYESLVAPPHAP